MKNKLKNKLKYKKLTITGKITLIYTSMFALMIVIVSLIALFNMWITYNSMSKSEINSAADKVEEYVCSGKMLDKGEIEKIIDNPYIEVIILNKSQKPGNNIGTMNNPERFPRIEDIQRREGDYYGRNSVDDVPYMFMHRSFEYNGDTYEILIFRKNQIENKMLYLCLTIIVITNLMSILVAVVIGKYISKKMLSPIREITEAAESISLYDLSQRIEVPETKDEIHTLVITFNDMIERLQENFNKENQFISDASHELKTPIAIIQGYINMIDRWGKDDPEILNESIESIKSETEHMNKLIQQLLYLARDTQGKNTVNIEKVSLCEVAEDVTKEIEVTNPDIITLFENEADDGIEIMSDIHMLKQLIWIFAENGIKYSGDKKCRLEIKTGYIDGRPYVSVADNGIGIEESALNKIFDRFYRYDESRNKKISGNGLGLSIAKSIAERLGGEIKVSSVVGEGSVFTVIFDE